jgi:hypothetical protein
MPLSHMELKTVRALFRASLRNAALAREFEFLRPVVERARAVGAALIGMALNGMPLFLVPEPGLDISALASEIRARATWDGDSWCLQSLEGTRLFSFDLSERVFARHAAREAARKPAAGAGPTPERLSEIHVSVFSEGTARIIRFVLDGDWTAHVGRALAAMRPRESQSSVTS